MITTESLWTTALSMSGPMDVIASINITQCVPLIKAPTHALPANDLCSTEAYEA